MSSEKWNRRLQKMNEMFDVHADKISKLIQVYSNN